MNYQTIINELKYFKNFLQDKAFLDKNSKGRKYKRDYDSVFFETVPPFWLDIYKIEGCKAYRRLKDKTQVFSFPENPHIRTRLSHTTEVAWFSMMAAHFLGLNIHLCEAIGKGHDIGHSPYGHLGEKFISEKIGKQFNHATFGVILAQKIERRGNGLNLSLETLEGILHHSSGDKDIIVDDNLLLEHNVVKIADKIVYTLSDINDAVRAGCIKKADLPPIIKDLGLKQGERILCCLAALVKESSQKGKISFEESEVAQKLKTVRKWMFENIYKKIDHDIHKAALSRMYEFLISESHFQDFDPVLLLALMTDREINKVAGLALQSAKLKMSDVENFGFMEILPALKNEEIDLFNPDLNWEK